MKQTAPSSEADSLLYVELYCFYVLREKSIIKTHSYKSADEQAVLYSMSRTVKDIIETHVKKTVTLCSLRQRARRRAPELLRTRRIKARAVTHCVITS